jgi:GPH family glycoside/pentoside/hexuronide:cation symporter
MGIQIGFAVIPAAIIVPAALALTFYRIDRKTIAKIEEDLSGRRSAAV